MDQIGVFSPEQARTLWQDYLSRQQLQSQLTRNYPQRRPIDEPSPHRAFVKNTTEETIPPFACMRITGVEVVGQRTAITVEKPTSTDGEFLFNGPYPIEAPAGAVPATEAGEFIPAKMGVGWAYRYGVVVMLGQPPSEPNVSYLPIVDSWEIEEGAGPFTVFGEYEITPESTTAALIGRIGGGSGGGSQWIEFTVVDVYCEGDYDNEEGEFYITATVDWYSDSCTKAPFGYDEYTGTVKIFDKCILQYYTPDQLMGGSGHTVKSGLASLMRPFRKAACTPRWICQSVCGEPVCGGEEFPPEDDGGEE
jgi:hypothetical protein